MNETGEEAGAPFAPEASAADSNVPSVAPAPMPSPNLANPVMSAGMATPGSGAVPNRMAMPPVFMMPMMMPMGFMAPALRSGPSFTPNFPIMNPAMAMPQPTLRPAAPMPMWVPPQWAMMRSPGLPVPVLPTTPLMLPVGIFQSFPPGLAARPSGFTNGLPMMPVPTMPLQYPPVGVYRPAYPGAWPTQVMPPMMGMPIMMPQSWGPMAGLPQPMSMPLQFPSPGAIRPMPVMPNPSPPQAAMIMGTMLAGLIPPMTGPAMAGPNAAAPVPWFMPWTMPFRPPLQPVVSTGNAAATPNRAITSDALTLPALPDPTPPGMSTTVAPAELSAPAAPNAVLPEPTQPAAVVEAMSDTAAHQDQPVPMAMLPEPNPPLPATLAADKSTASSPAPAISGSATHTVRRASIEPDPCSKGFRRIKSRVRAPKRVINASWHHKSRFTPCGDQPKPVQQVKHVVKARTNNAKQKNTATVKVRANHRVCFDKGQFKGC